MLYPLIYQRFMLLHECKVLFKIIHSHFTIYRLILSFIFILYLFFILNNLKTIAINIELLANIALPYNK